METIERSTKEKALSERVFDEVYEQGELFKRFFKLLEHLKPAGFHPGSVIKTSVFEFKEERAYCTCGGEAEGGICTEKCDLNAPGFIWRDKNSDFVYVVEWTKKTSFLIGMRFEPISYGQFLQMVEQCVHSLLPAELSDENLIEGESYVPVCG